MSTDKIVELFENEEFIEKYNSCESTSKKSELLSENGISITEDDIKFLETYTQNGCSLKDNDLQDISGGAELKPFLKGAAALVSAAAAASLVYVGGKLYNKKSSKIISEPTASESLLPPTKKIGYDVISPTGQNLSDSPNIFSPVNNENYDDINFEFNIF